MGEALITRRGGSGKKRLITEILTWSQKWKCPEGVTSINVRLFGGGGGTYSYSHVDLGEVSVGGGCGGHMAYSELTVTPNEEYTVTIGTCGGISYNTLNGGASSFGNLLTANGGEGCSVVTSQISGGSCGGGNATNYYGGNATYGGGGGGIGAGNGGNGGTYGGGGGGSGSYYGSSGSGGNGGTYGGGGGGGCSLDNPGRGGGGGTYGGNGGSGGYEGRDGTNGTDGTNTIGMGLEYEGEGLAGTAGSTYQGYGGAGGGGGGYGPLGNGGYDENNGVTMPEAHGGFAAGGAGDGMGGPGICIITYMM